MFQCGDLIVYGNNGVCVVERVTTLEGSPNKEQLYYVLKNKSSNGTAYVPVNSPVHMRHIMTKEQALALIDKIPFVETKQFAGIATRQAQKVYRDALLSYDSETVVGVIKHLRATGEKKHSLGKKLSSTEERYLEQAQRIIDSELCAAMEMTVEQLRGFISKRIGDGKI